MYKVRRLRAMGAVCRKNAVYHPDRAIRLIAEAEFWERLAEHELAANNAMRTAQVMRRHEANPQTRITRHRRRPSAPAYSHASGLAQESKAVNAKNTKLTITCRDGLA